VSQHGARHNDDIDITQSHLSALELGDNEPGASVLLSTSRALGKSVDWLLTGEKIKQR
jgi:transcriptional regulator with XRE-family HTH domain